MIKKHSISVIGTGHLGSALVHGIIKSGYPYNQIVVSNRNPEKINKFEKILGISCTIDNITAVENADVVFLAVKPQFIKQVCHEIAPTIQKNRPLIISLASVISLKEISLTLGADVGIVRVMTNTPTEYCKGTSALFANSCTTPLQIELTNSIFNAVGTSFWVEQETLLDTLTAPVGCAPAYVFLFLEALQEAAMSRGVVPELAKKIALNAVIGAAELAEHSGESFSTLREKVMTPGGVTAHSLRQLSTPDFFDLFKHIYAEAENRVDEIKRTK